MISIKQLLLSTLLFSNATSAIPCFKKYQKTDDSKSHEIHIHNHQLSKTINKKGVVLTLLTLGSGLSTLILNTTSTITSAPTYEIQHAYPYNSSIDSSIDYQHASGKEQCSYHTAFCDPQEIAYYDEICTDHDKTHNGTNLAKRFLKKITNVKRNSALQNNGPCADACAQIDNQKECTDLSIRDNAVIIEKCDGYKKDTSSTLFNINLGSLASQTLTMFFIAGLGTMASGCFN